jgi:hypothetical protein
MRFVVGGASLALLGVRITGLTILCILDAFATVDEYVRSDVWGSTGINPRGSRSLLLALVASARAPGKKPVRDRPGVTDGRRI